MALHGLRRFTLNGHSIRRLFSAVSVHGRQACGPCPLLCLSEKSKRSAGSEALVIHSHRRPLCRECTFRLKSCPPFTSSRAATVTASAYVLERILLVKSSRVSLPRWKYNGRYRRLATQKDSVAWMPMRIRGNRRVHSLETRVEADPMPTWWRHSRTHA